MFERYLKVPRYCRGTPTAIGKGKDMVRRARIWLHLVRFKGPALQCLGLVQLLDMVLPCRVPVRFRGMALPCRDPDLRRP